MKGTQNPENQGSLTNILEFWYQSKTLNVNTIAPVKVLEYNDLGTVDVELMIQGIDADNNALEPLKIFNNPVLTLSASKTSLQILPTPGDIGLMAFCQRDISKIKDTKKTNIPDSLRRFSLSDGIYLGAILYDQSSSDTVISANDTEIKLFTKDASLSIDKNITLEGAVISIEGATEVNIEASKVITQANGQNAVKILKNAIDTLATNCALPTAPGKPVITPADLALIQVDLALLGGFE